MKKALLILSFLGYSLFIFAQAEVSDFNIGEKFTMVSDENGNDYNIAVFLPRGYEEGKKDYPTIYLFLGYDNMFHATSGIVRLMGDQGQIPQSIVIGITNIRWWPDLTPEKLEWREEAGGGKAFLNFVSKQLVPKIDKDYNTTGHRTYIGHSLGGMFGVYTMTEEEKLFNDFVLISPSIADRANSLFGLMENQITSNKDFSHDVYITMGNEGDRIARGLHLVSAAFTKYEGKNLNWKTVQMDGHDHFTLIIPTIVDGLKYVSKNDLKEED